MSTRHMIAFDRLPSDVRRMLTELDFNYAADQVLILHEAGYSAEQIRERLIRHQTEKHRADAASGAIPLQR